MVDALKLISDTFGNEIDDIPIPLDLITENSSSDIRELCKNLDVAHKAGLPINGWRSNVDWNKWGKRAYSFQPFVWGSGSKRSILSNGFMLEEFEKQVEEKRLKEGDFAKYLDFGITQFFYSKNQAEWTRDQKNAVDGLAKAIKKYDINRKKAIELAKSDGMSLMGWMEHYHTEDMYKKLIDDLDVCMAEELKKLGEVELANPENIYSVEDWVENTCVFVMLSALNVSSFTIASVVTMLMTDPLMTAPCIMIGSAIINMFVRPLMRKGIHMHRHYNPYSSRIKLYEDPSIMKDLKTSWFELFGFLSRQGEIDAKYPNINLSKFPNINNTDVVGPKGSSHRTMMQNVMHFLSGGMTETSLPKESKEYTKETTGDSKKLVFLRENMEVYKGLTNFALQATMFAGSAMVLMTNMYMSSDGADAGISGEDMGGEGWYSNMNQQSVQDLDMFSFQTQIGGGYNKRCKKCKNARARCACCISGGVGCGGYVF